MANFGPLHLLVIVTVMSLAFVTTPQFYAIVGTAFLLYFVWKFLLQSLYEAHEDKKALTRRIRIHEAARAVHESKEAVESFMERNPHETFASHRGRAMLLHHTHLYSLYLELVGIPKDEKNNFKDAYWAQLTDMARKADERRILPRFPPAVDLRHHHLYAAK